MRPGTRFTIKYPITVKHFEEFFRLLPERAISERSWRVPIEEIQAKNYDLKAVNPNKKDSGDKRTPEELLAIIESQSTEIAEALRILKNKGI